MKDFAYWLHLNRERAGLNQAQLAAEVGQSGAYISMLESRRKPPPSDEVVRKIARALQVSEDKLLEVAHLERTPPDIQAKVFDLDRLLRRERRSRQTLVERLLPAALFPLFAVDGAPLLRQLPVPEEQLAGVLELASQLAGIRDYEAFAVRLRSLYEELPSADRNLLLEVLGQYPTDQVLAPPRAQLPIFLEVPAAPVSESAGEVSGRKEIPTGDWSPTRYGLIVTGHEMHPRLEHGDLVVVDEAATPANGDIVAVLDHGRGRLLRLLELGHGRELAPLNPQFPPLVLAPDDGEIRLRGVVVSVVRDLR